MAALSAAEYQRWYDYGVLPERCHDEEFLRLRGRFLAEDLTLAEYEEELDTMLGLDR